MILIRLTKEELKDLLEGKTSIIQEVYVEGIEWIEKVGICCESTEMSNEFSELEDDTRGNC